jgi:hypothetical protein
VGRERKSPVLDRTIVECACQRKQQVIFMERILHEPNPITPFLSAAWGANTDGALNGVHFIAEPAQIGWMHHPVYTVADAVRKAQEISDAGRNAYFACSEYLTLERPRRQRVTGTQPNAKRLTRWRSSAK